MAEPSASESSADSDQDFDPTVEMLVNDFDDEHTLEEEEAMESADSVTNELDDLQREGEMPLEELLAMYGYGTDDPVNGNPIKCPFPNDRPVDSEEHHNIKKVLMVPIPNLIVRDEVVPSDDIPDTSMGTGPLLRSVSQASESSDTGTDDDYSPDDDWRKTIQVGSDYQASIPEGLCKYDDAPAYENEDRLLWDPSKMLDHEVEDYLRDAQQSHGNGQGINCIPVGNHIRDNEQLKQWLEEQRTTSLKSKWALFLLLQCGHNVDEALRRRRMQPLHPADHCIFVRPMWCMSGLVTFLRLLNGLKLDPTQMPLASIRFALDTMSLWSEDECRSFEGGLRTYGKDFHMIQQNKVRTRSVGELVQFYYLWKKTERHDVFASKNRLEKKKYALHPGTTDYMDKFLDEQENPSVNRDRSSSPSAHSVISGENRKRTPACSPSSNITKTDSILNSGSQQASHMYLDASYSSGIDRNARLHSPSKLHSGNAVSDLSKEFFNGEDRISVVAASKNQGSLLPNELQTPRLENLPSHLISEKHLPNTVSEVMTCAHRSSETTKLNDSSLADPCNPRFEAHIGKVTSTE